ncbi:MAG: C1 family peptidase, partial [Schleiferiaceae bacterium]|nr:C1 family peptidase [Schleiferiaceae bacterium]
ITPNWKTAYNGILDSYLGAYPEEFEWNGKKYTPRSFADKVVGINPDDYVQLMSFTHQPMNDWCQIQVPDNWAWGDSYNMPIDDMMAALDNALDNGYTVSWATDVSEKGFSLKSGLAIVPVGDLKKMSAEERMAHFETPHEEMVITQENRQEAYDNYQTQDDHGMQITGRVKDQNGTKYYIVKNSWGDRANGYRTGYLHVSEAFVRYKTISIMFHKDGLAKKMKKQMEL